MRTRASHAHVLELSVIFIMLSIQTAAPQTAARTDLQMAAAGGRDGACSAPLKEGRSLVTGGKNATGPLATAKYFERGGRFRSVSPMLAPRTDHVCIALDNGTVLVAGGAISGNRVTNAAEIFHPDTNTWTPAGPMLTARRGAAIILMNDGKALVAGGEVSGQAITTFEIYDPAESRFEQAAGILSAARTGYALAVLGDGRVLLAGGTDGTHELARQRCTIRRPARSYPPVRWRLHGRITSQSARLKPAACSSRAEPPAGGRSLQRNSSHPLKMRLSPLQKSTTETTPLQLSALASSVRMRPCAQLKPTAFPQKVFSSLSCSMPFWRVSGIAFV